VSAVPWPNFLVIGAAKCGTTSVDHYLAEHPEIFMSHLKNPKYFADQAGTPSRYVWGEGIASERLTVTDPLQYLSLFENVTTEKAIGEVSPVYLGSEIAPENILRTIPDVRLVAILRNPIERAYSGYQMQLRQCGRKITMDSEFRLDGHLVQQGRYHTLLKRYFDRFDRSRIKVMIFENLRSEPLAAMRDLYRFLDVDESFRPDVTRAYNRGAGQLLPDRVGRHVRPLFRALTLRPASPMPAALRRRLHDAYRDDVARLSVLLDLDLESRWLGSG
jgi:hypothetical protein